LPSLLLTDRDVVQFLHDTRFIHDQDCCASVPHHSRSAVELSRRMDFARGLPRLPRGCHRQNGRMAGPGESKTARR